MRSIAKSHLSFGTFDDVVRGLGLICLIRVLSIWTMFGNDFIDFKITLKRLLVYLDNLTIYLIDRVGLKFEKDL